MKNEKVKYKMSNIERPMFSLRPKLVFAFGFLPSALALHFAYSLQLKAYSCFPN